MPDSHTPKRRLTVPQPIDAILDPEHDLENRILAQLGPDTLVIATGGLADFVLSETDVVDVHDPTLTLKGLRLYYERNVTCNSR